MIEYYAVIYKSDPATGGEYTTETEHRFVATEDALSFKQAKAFCKYQFNSDPLFAGADIKTERGEVVYELSAWGEEC